MESDRFDRLVRVVGQASSRRQVLRQRAGIAVAGALARGGGEAAAEGLEQRAARRGTRERANRSKRAASVAAPWVAA